MSSLSEDSFDSGASCESDADLCEEVRYLDRKTYKKEILISRFTENTTLEDLRIRFSVYGAIKDCYWLSGVSNSKKDRKACIIFFEAYSGMKAMLHGQKHEIFLFDQRLTVFPNSKNIDETRFHLINHPGDTSISKLSDDCLLEIFGYLPILDRLMIRRVCTRWCSIANKSLKTLLYLDLGMYRRELDTFKTFNRREELRKLSLNLAQRQLDMQEFLSTCLGSLPEYHVITSLNKHLVAVDGQNLTKLIIRFATYNEDILSLIFKMNQGLRHVEIHENPFLRGKSLKYLPANLNTFIVNGCRNLQSYSICAALKRLKNLKCVKLIGRKGGDVSNVFDQYCKNLETLHLDFMNNRIHIDFDKFSPIVNLKNLRDLGIFIRCNAIPDTFFVNLSNNCQELRCLKLHVKEKCWPISDRALNAITSLSKLEILSMEFNGFNPFEELQNVNIGRRGNTIREQILTIIRNLPGLKKLNIADHVTKDIFSEVRKISASRCNDIILEIITDEDYTHPVARRVIFNGKIY